ncbi:MAG: hypothetical protein QOE82_2507 [Thermoanaerobaculia bacterium]|jgi:hypothetical protein|nr:hypothetical protein [Thermoanaerobaculia bacterium]
MESPEKVIRAAIPSELMSAIDQTPSLIVPVVVSFAGLEAIPLAGTPLAGVPSPSLHLFAGCLGALIGVVLYSGGDYWDKTVFDPRYGPGGKWIAKEPKFFPSAKDLANNRGAAASQLPGVNRETQEGVYAAAEDLVREAGRWSDVQAPLVISKFVRSFIWPSFLAATVVGVLAVLALFGLDYDRAAAAGGLAIVCTATGIATFVPYLHFRVKHMARLYRLAARLTQRRPDA